MEDIFIKSIHISKVRHLQNVEIPISETERKHLILTGKNGSGKTSVLLEIKKLIELISDKSISRFNEFKSAIISTKNQIRKIEEQIIEQYKSKENAYGNERNNIDDYIKHLKNDMSAHEKNTTNFESWLKEWLFSKDIGLDVDFTSNEISMVYEVGNILFTYFAAKRNLEFKVPKGINKVEIKNKYSVEENAGKDFLQHIVNLKADRSFARDENDKVSVNQIDSWFENFERSLKDIFDDKEIKLEFDRKSYSFRIINHNNEASDFTTLSDGYSAILNIISELIMRMESKASKSYDIQGIVLIDEIETHLHIDLQKKILPFLTNFFPKIQFIVTTHSPFILNSIENAVVFDLEKKVLIEDMTGYSINSIVESYFNSDNYSMVVKEKVIEYENLLNKSDLNEEEEEQLFDLKRYFKDLPKMFSPELALKINQLTLANLSLK